ncbi:hypothetical protein, partial [Burkholderia stagnalis]|uniref:hypothetical protein n=1 Tax=Burkholderia stagnalis TaxID=1503054 RepID=UPI001C89C278
MSELVGWRRLDDNYDARRKDVGLYDKKPQKADQNPKHTVRKPAPKNTTSELFYGELERKRGMPLISTEGQMHFNLRNPIQALLFALCHGSPLWSQSVIAVKAPRDDRRIGA